MPESEIGRHQLHGMQPVLAVPDVKEAVEYYRDTFGFHIDFMEGDPPVHARVCADPTYSSPTVHIRFEPLEPGASVNPSVYLFVHVAVGLDELFERLRGRGVTVHSEPKDRPWGLRQFIVEDCNGYLLCFVAEIEHA